MKLNVTLLNFLKYEDKETHQPKIRIGYINQDTNYISNKDKFKGYAELSVFLDDDKAWDLLDVDMCGRSAELEFTSTPNPRNPLKNITKLVAIRAKGHADISFV